jgi:putative DNA methylase
MTHPENHKLIDRWFPCAAVDTAVGTKAGSGRSEKAIFTWFASRPVAQARAAVLTSLLPDNDPSLRAHAEAAIRRGDADAIRAIRHTIGETYPSGRPVVLDIFSGRGIIPLEASRFGATALGIDLSPVATLAGRLLGDYPQRDWSSEPALPFAAPVPGSQAGDDDSEQVAMEEIENEPKLVSDARRMLAEVGRRAAGAVAPYFPAGTKGNVPWGYIWAVKIPCDGCNSRFPLVGSLSLRHPYAHTSDKGQSFNVMTKGRKFVIEVVDGIPKQKPTFRSAEGKKGKSAHCPFCRHVHSLDAVKAKGAAGEYEDALLIVADTAEGTKKVFRTPTAVEAKAAQSVQLAALGKIGPFMAIPDELIPAGNEDTVRASGYGFRTFGSLMGGRQALQFVETVRAIRSCHADLISVGVSSDYAAALAGYASASMIRRMRRATRGARLEMRGSISGAGQNRVYVGDVFSDESKVSFNFDFVETGPGSGAGSWESVCESEIAALADVVRATTDKAAKFRRGSALALPMRDSSVDAVITDPPYYNMIDYADASDMFYVWLNRIFFDIMPDLFGRTGVQEKDEEIIVKRGGDASEHRTRDYYEASLAKAFAEARRVLREDGHLVVVFGHADPDAWRRLLGALHHAGFVVTSSWPSRTEAANTGVASIKVTVTIGCRVGAVSRPAVTAAQVDREVAEAVRDRAKDWARDGLALPDQMMAAYGPAMEVYGRYSSVLMPDGTSAPLEQYLTLARKAVRDAMALKLEQIPLETFDPVTAFAVFWMRAFGRTAVPKGEAKFSAQSSNLRIEEVRQLVLEDASGGYKLVITDPKLPVQAASPVFNVVRAIAAAWQREGSEGVASVLINSERLPDDQHVWAVVGDLATQLPSSDTVAKALAAIQRNRSTIESLARGLSQHRAPTDSQLQLTNS